MIKPFIIKPFEKSLNAPFIGLIPKVVGAENLSPLGWWGVCIKFMPKSLLQD